MHVCAAASAALMLLLCNGCNVGPEYVPPAVEVPDQWKAVTTTTPQEVYTLDYWWEIFNDETLNQLEQDAIANNPNLYVAVERVIEARAMAGARKAELFPQVTLNPSYNDSASLYQFFLPPGIVLPASTTAPSVFRIHQFQYVLPVNMSYEVDLWGKIRDQYESAVMSAQAQEEAYFTTLLSLTTDLASSYYQLRSLDLQVELFQATKRELQAGYDLTKSRYDKGLVNLLDVTQAQLQLSNVDAELIDTVRQRNLQVDQIAVLLGVPPATISIANRPLQGNPPEIPAGVPLTVLMQRPDIAEAERNMAAENALVGAAYASFLPSLTLTTTLGFSSPTLHDFMSWISRLWSFGGSADQTIFDGGLKKANLQIAWARFHEASGTYQQQVLVAFKEVEDALNNLDLEAQQAASLTQSVQAATTAVSLSINRYKSGLVPYLQVVDSQRSALEAQRTLATLQGLRYLSTVQLIKALGGNWSCE